MLAMQLGSILMFLAGIALLTALLMRRSYRYFGGRKRRFDTRPIDAQPRPKSKWDGAMHDSMAVIEQQQVELAQLSRDVNGQLDTKILILRELIARSEKQIERMEELLREGQKM
ncbi:hypothetical protein [Aeoliella sp. SH292]|jgi:hypothetical protein|uniref:hypothetical protein n=1 Tax=Aeoliella sp. SH292 TaxID=3454464 RepID=UPI003F975542